MIEGWSNIPTDNVKKSWSVETDDRNDDDCDSNHRHHHGLYSHHFYRVGGKRIITNFGGCTRTSLESDKKKIKDNLCVCVSLCETIAPEQSKNLEKI